MDNKEELVQINVKLDPIDKQKLDIFVAMMKTDITKVIREKVHETVKGVVIPEQAR